MLAKEKEKEMEMEMERKMDSAKQRNDSNEELKEAASDEDEDEEELLDEDELLEKQKREKAEKQRKLENDAAKMQELNSSSLSVRIKQIAAEVIDQYKVSKTLLERVAKFEVRRLDAMEVLAKFDTENDND